MKHSTVYYRAAKWMDETHGSWLIAYACMTVEPHDRHPARCKHLTEWLGSAYPDQNEFDKTASILCLLLLAEVCK